MDFHYDFTHKNFTISPFLPCWVKWDRWELFLLSMYFINGFAQECDNCTVLAMELLQFCAMPSIYGKWTMEICIHLTCLHYTVWCMAVLWCPPPWHMGVCDPWCPAMHQYVLCIVAGVGCRDWSTWIPHKVVSLVPSSHIKLLEVSH